MKILLLSRYDRLGASSRLRMMQYIPVLEQAGFSVILESLFDDVYITDLYSGRPNVRQILQAYRQRISSLRRGRDIDVIWLEKEALPWIPAFLELSILPKGVPVVADYDDAVFHQYDLHRSTVVRSLLGNKLDKIMGKALLVTAGNRYLAERAIAAGAPRVDIIPTVVDLTAYKERSEPHIAGAPTIGWIGSPSTWTEYMAPMMPLLTEMAQSTRARMLVVGAGKAAGNHPKIDSFPWTEESEVPRIHAMDIGIMPLNDTPWARGKCGYKLIQYMACGVPVIASPVGINADIVEHGINGFLASTEAEWVESLNILMSDPALRVRMGRAGRIKAAREYSLQVWGPRVAEMIHQVASTGCP